MLLTIHEHESFQPHATVGEAPAEVSRTVAEIIARVRAEGDEAVAELTSRFDRLDVSAASLEIPRATIESVAAEAPEDVAALLSFAAGRIREFHERQKGVGYRHVDLDDNVLGQRIVPLARVGVYVPGGTAAYPSSVLMNVIPAKVAGVREIIMVTPTPDGVINPVVMAAALEAGVDRVFRVGGAQAVAALAHGTASIPRVDKIVGPGNIWVATAKRQVYGAVDIDMIAGPSEVLVVCDEGTDPELVAADLLAQAEHDPDAVAGVITTDAALLPKIEVALEAQLASLPRADIARRSLEANGYAVVAPSRERALELADEVAPEHLELLLEDPFEAMERVRNAGAVFVGPWTPEAMGDYLAGPNHVLPTAGTARFFSGLGVPDFERRMNYLSLTREGLRALGPPAERFARLESLDAHAESVAARVRRAGGDDGD